MIEMSPLKRHYLFVFPFVFLILILTFFIKGSFIFTSFFTLGFLWIWVPLTPGLKEKSRSPRYRISFFRFMFWSIHILEDQMFFASDRIVKTLSRVFSGLIFAILISLMSDPVIVIFNFLGLCAGELWLLINKRHYPESYLKSDDSLSENSL